MSMHFPLGLGSVLTIWPSTVTKTKKGHTKYCGHFSSSMADF